MLLAGFIGFFAGTAYLAYELGRHQAGFSLLDVRRQSQAWSIEADRYRTEIDDLRRQVAILETARDIDRETYSQVEENLAQLEAQIQSQGEELAFYQGIVSPTDGTAGLRIQAVELEPIDRERRYLVRVVLVQAIVHSGKVAGSVELRIIGASGGADEALDLTSLVADSPVASIPYDFRYFQTIEREVQLPEDFTAEALEIEIQPSEPRGAAFVQNYSWEALGG